MKYGSSFLTSHKIWLKKKVSNIGPLVILHLYQENIFEPDPSYTEFIRKNISFWLLTSFKYFLQSSLSHRPGKLINTCLPLTLNDKLIWDYVRDRPRPSEKQISNTELLYRGLDINGLPEK